VECHSVFEDCLNWKNRPGNRHAQAVYRLENNFLLQFRCVLVSDLTGSSFLCPAQNGLAARSDLFCPKILLLTLESPILGEGFLEEEFQLPCKAGKMVSVLFW
jgi:hypothetical protein